MSDPSSSRHLLKDEFLAYLEGRLRNPSLRIHLLECSECRQEAEDLRQHEDLKKFAARRTF